MPGQTSETTRPAPSPTARDAAPAPTGGSRGAVQLKQSLRGQGFAEQSARLAPEDGAPVQRREASSGARDPVQMTPLSNQTVSSGEQAIVDQRAADRGVTLQDRELKERGTKVGDGKVNVDDTKSMAENPAFEADALSFEKNLGIAAYSRGQGAADAMAGKARDYLLTKVGGTEWTARTTALNAELQKIGSDNPKWSGSVGKAFQDLLDALMTGNVAVKMCHLENFYTAILVPDIKADTAPIDALLAGVDTVKKAKAEAQIANIKTGGGGAPFRIPTADSEVNGQAKTRGEENPGGDTTPSQQTGASVGVPLDPAELRVQQGTTQAGKSAADTHLQWEEGAEKWALNEYNKWVFLMRQLSLPLMAGPSGTTNKLMNLGTALGMDPYDTRLACMGYLLPARHHSLVEVMAAAAPHGAADFIAGRRMYTSITPFTPAELKGFGGGKFPHERHGDKSLVGDQVVSS